jgi:hypothetical protein
MEPFYSPFIEPKRVKLELKRPGLFIEIRDRLNAGELEKLHAKWQPIIKSGQGVELQTVEIRFAKVMAYLLRWSFVDADGQPEELNRDAVESLDPSVFSEIHRLIEAHEAKRDAEVEAMKADPPGATELSETLQSVAP